ncbi:hypothetical protein LSH36_511g00006 [Paralvinella palmiformis]|uniref:Uncharacterized protein n=1 Tax=Paralvinella palmiformis TaxID=53620 RepID=A0AAD9J7P7_9ANNE|nr:hypothetical protein LSH36_511g00006 [Paralvinella palmiformis]
MLFLCTFSGYVNHLNEAYNTAKFTYHAGSSLSLHHINKCRLRKKSIKTFSEISMCMHAMQMESVKMYCGAFPKSKMMMVGVIYGHFCAHSRLKGPSDLQR